MKTLKFIVMAMFAVALSMSFTACSSSDGDDDGGQENQESNGNQSGNENNDYIQKYITVKQSKYVDNINSNGEIGISEQTVNVSYDDILLTRIDWSNTNINQYWVFDYGTSKIINKYHNITDNYYDYSFTIDDNFCITKIESPDYTSSIMNVLHHHKENIQFKYNEGRQLISSEHNSISYITTLDGSESITSGSKQTVNYSWKNGNLVKVVVENREYDISSEEYNECYNDTYIFEYGNISNKGNIQPNEIIANIWPFDNIIQSIVMSSGLFGVLSKNLPTKVILNDEISMNFTYELDEQGFVKSVSAKGDCGNDYTKSPFVYSSSFTYKN